MPNHTYLLAAIDGTGSRAEHDRLAALHLPTRTQLSSNVLEFYYDFRTDPRFKNYFPGPDSNIIGVDGELNAIVNNVVRFIRRAYYLATNELTQMRRETGDQIKISLVGHSRGGLVAILAARQIFHEIGARVFFLGLYDAVDWSFGYDGSMIHYVDHTFHALRNSYEVDIPGCFFGNTGLQSTGNYTPILVRGTHGEVGWDSRFSSNTWIRSNARSLGLPIN